MRPFPRMRPGAAAAASVALLLGACALAPSRADRASGRATVEGLLLAPDAPRFLVCAHRGDYFAALAGHNTISAFEKALAHGADLVEVDVQLTRDGRPVLAHDDWPSERTLAEWRKRGGGPPALADALAWARGRVVLVLDLKDKDLRPSIEAVRVAEATDRVLFYAGDEQEYDALRRGGADLVAMVRARAPDEADAWLARGDPRIVVVHGDYAWLTEEVVRRIRARGRRVFANSYKLPWHGELFGAGGSARRLFERGIDIAQTNNPSGAARARKEANREHEAAGGARPR